MYVSRAVITYVSKVNVAELSLPLSLCVYTYIARNERAGTSHRHRVI